MKRKPFFSRPSIPDNPEEERFKALLGIIQDNVTLRLATQEEVERSELQERRGISMATTAERHIYDQREYFSGLHKGEYFFTSEVMINRIIGKANDEKSVFTTGPGDVRLSMFFPPSREINLNWLLGFSTMLLHIVGKMDVDRIVVMLKKDEEELKDFLKGMGFTCEQTDSPGAASEWVCWMFVGEYKGKINYVIRQKM